MNTVVFHIGLPKTGSSALQVFLAQNREALLHHGVDYFKTGEFAQGAAGAITSGNGALVARCLLPENHPAKIKDKREPLAALLKAVESSPAAVGVLSSELLVEADHTLLEELLRELTAMGVRSKVVYFVRSQHQILCSMYIQQVKRHRSTEDVDSFVSKTYPHVGFLKYNSHYNRLLAIFGEGQVHVELYEAALKKGGIFREFLRILAVEAAELNYDVVDVNTSLSSKELAIMLLLNRFQPRMQFSDYVVENSLSFGLSRSGGVHRLLSAARVEEIRSYFAGENRQLSERLFGGVDIFEQVAVSGAPQTAKSEDITTHDLVAFFGGLLVRYDRRLAQTETRLGQIEKQLKG